METKDVFPRLEVYNSIAKEYIDIIKNENNGGNTMEDKINSFEITENKDVILKNARHETILEIPDLIIAYTPVISNIAEDIILKKANKLSKQIEKEIEDKFNIK